MKGDWRVLRVSGPLLVFGGLALSQGNASLSSTMVETVKDPVQGGFRTFMKFTVGDQTIKGLLDTGSSDLTVQRSGSSICKNPTQQCDNKSKTGDVFGAFNANQSDVKQLNVPLNTSFTGGAAFQGEFVQTPFRVSEKTEVDLQMGLIETGNPPPGSVLFPVIGVGPVQGESTTQENITYPNLPARLKEAGATKANAFGLYLGDFRSPENGSIVWGGFDAAKFDGDLQKVNIERDSAGQMPSFVVSLASVRVTKMNDNTPSGRGDGNKDQQGERGGGNGFQGKPSGGNDAEQAGRGKRNRAASSPERRSTWSGQIRRLSKRHTYKRSAEHLSEHEIQKRQRDGNLLMQRDQVVLVDTGDPTLTLPLDTVEALAGMLDAQPDEKTGFFRVDCKRIEGMALSFGMDKDNAKINVPLEPMVLGPEFDKDPPGFLSEGQAGGPNGGQGSQSGGGNGGGNSQGDRNGNGGSKSQGGRNDDQRGARNNGPRRRDPASPNGRGDNGQAGDAGAQGGGAGNGAGSNRACQLPITPIEGDDNLSIFGSPAMQAMYVVFDMDSQALMFGQARLNETKTDLREYVLPTSGSQGGGGAGGENGKGQGK